MRFVQFRVVILALVPLLSACVGGPERLPPLVVNVRAQGQGCRVTVEGERVTADRLVEIARAAPDRRGIVVSPVDTPLRCVGGAIYALQRGGLAHVDHAPWYD